MNHLLKNLEGLDIEQNYVVASQHLEVIERYIREADVANVTVVRGLGWETGGDLALALEQIGRDEDAIVMNGDIITDRKVPEVLDFHRQKGGLATISVFRLDDEVEARRFGRVILDEQSRIVSFEEKAGDGASGPPLVNSGLYVFDRKLIQNRTHYLVPRKFRLETDLFPVLAREGVLFGHEADLGYWWDVGTLDSYLKAEEYLVSRRGVIPPD